MSHMCEGQGQSWALARWRLDGKRDSPSDYSLNEFVRKKNKKEEKYNCPYTEMCLFVILDLVSRWKEKKKSDTHLGLGFTLPVWVAWEMPSPKKTVTLS